MTVRALSGEETTLPSLGLEEVEPWVVADTVDNRRILRRAKLAWSDVTDEFGEYHGLIRAYSPEDLTARRLSVWADREVILSDPENPWSDYIKATDYPSDFPCPYWVRAATRRYVMELDMENPPKKPAVLPLRCDMVRVDGTRCWNWAARRDGIQRCRDHLTWQAKADASKPHRARIKLMQAAPMAAEVLEALADSANGESVKLKAATEILDRVGVRGGVEIDVAGSLEVTDPVSVVREKLDALGKRLLEAENERLRREAEAEAEIVDGEVVEDGTALELEAAANALADRDV